MSNSLVNKAKQLAACAAIDKHVSASTKRIGIGSGSTIVFAVERLAARVRDEKLDVLCVPTSFQARQLILQHDLPLSDLDRSPKLDVAFDGADEVDAARNLIKGGGGCLFQEKLVASCAASLIIVADFRKDSDKLGQQWTKGVPIEVVPMARVPVLAQVRALGALSAEVREGSGKAGPVVTDNGNFIVDAHFGPIDDVAALDRRLRDIVGVLETGLFVAMADKVYFGGEDGTVYSK